ncbi:MAG TPA: hypothetical protein VK993_05500 [Chthoniobacterales bacterium]|nr:hypothetical protein [Chthoniobacterales bacterium]
MAKKKSLKERIDALVHALGGAEKPSFADIRSELVSIGLSIEEIESGQALTEKDTRITNLEAQLGDLNVSLEQAKGELNAVRADRKKHEEKQEDIPQDQLRILQLLPTPFAQDYGPTAEAISRAVGKPLDETVIHIRRLEKGPPPLIEWQTDQFGQAVWFRTDEGNKLVVAKRWADEAEQRAHRKYADLPDDQARALRMIAAGGDGGESETVIAKNLGLNVLANSLFVLEPLREAQMATPSEAPDYGTGTKWLILRNGVEYLVERNLL